MRKPVVQHLLHTFRPATRRMKHRRIRRLSITAALETEFDI
jgi:hypothetical protein